MKLAEFICKAASTRAFSILAARYFARSFQYELRAFAEIGFVDFRHYRLRIFFRQFLLFGTRSAFNFRRYFSMRIPRNRLIFCTP
jgi:hypothetical protein